MTKTQRTGVPVDRRCIAVDPNTEKAAMRTILLISCVALALCGPRISLGEDTSLDTPSWSGLRLNGNSSVIDLSSPADPNRNVVRQAPALTGRFQFNDQTFIPFIGAGFGGGYANDRDRALGSNGLFHNPAQSGDLGKNMMPNEFNLGLRIPF